MLPEAVERYHVLLTNHDLAEASRAVLDEGLERARLMFGGRRLSPYLRPHFVTEADLRGSARSAKSSGLQFRK